MQVELRLSCVQNVIKNRLLVVANKFDNDFQTAEVSPSIISCFEQLIF